MYKFRLYMVGETPNSKRACEELKATLQEAFGRGYSLETLDILKNWAQAQDDNIIATPTLIQVEPEPAKRIIGDFRDKERVLSALGLAA